MSVPRFLSLLVMASALLGADRVAAATYYLNPATGSDGNPGTQTLPWQTMPKVKTTVAAGDTVNIVGGTYTQAQVEPGGGNPLWAEYHAAGTPGTPITIQASPGETVLFQGEGRGYWQYFSPHNGVAPYAPRHIVVRNLAFAGYTSAVIGVNVTSHVAILHCVFRDTYDGDSAAIPINDADHVIVRGNRFFNIGDPSRGFAGNGDHGIYPSDNATFIVVEGNTLDQVGGFGIHTWNTHYGIPSLSRQLILRRNTISNAAASGIIVAGDTYQHVYVYHNTVYADPVPFAAIYQGPSDDAITLHNGARYQHVRITNNIGSGPFSRAPFTQDDHTQIVGFGLDYNLWHNRSTATRTVGWDLTYYTLPDFQAATGYDRNSQAGDPQFTNSAARDFTLRPESPAIDAGTFLTTTVGAGSGTTVPVVDAGFFTDGFGLVPGDLIQVGTQGLVQVTSVQHATNSLVVDRSVTWQAGDGVSLPYAGARPDLGAHESGTVGSPVPVPPKPRMPAPTNLRARALP